MAIGLSEAVIARFVRARLVDDNGSRQPPAGESPLLESSLPGRRQTSPGASRAQLDQSIVTTAGVPRTQVVAKGFHAAAAASEEWCLDNSERMRRLTGYTPMSRVTSRTK